VLREDHGRRLPLNAAGANGAVLADMGLDPLLGRGLALIGRAAGLVAHVYEERSSPTGQQVWDLVLRQDERNVLARKG
jgi:citrate synthase